MLSDDGWGPTLNFSNRSAILNSFYKLSSRSAYCIYRPSFYRSELWPKGRQRIRWAVNLRRVKRVSVAYNANRENEVGKIFINSLYLNRGEDLNSNKLLNLAGQTVISDQS